MKKKSLILIFLVVTVPCQAVWELPVTFLMGMAFATPTGKKISGRIFAQFKKVWLLKKPSIKIENISTNDSITKSDIVNGVVFFGKAFKAVAIKSHEALSSTLVAFRARAQKVMLKNHLVYQSKKEDMQLNWSTFQHQSAREQEAQKNRAYSYNFTKNESQSISQSASGFFPKTTSNYTTNYYSGIPEHVVEKMLKKEYKSGVKDSAFVGITTAMGATILWLRSQREEKK